MQPQVPAFVSSPAAEAPPPHRRLLFTSHSLFHCLNRKPPCAPPLHRCRHRAFGSLHTHPSPSAPFFVSKNKHQIVFLSFFFFSFCQSHFSQALMLGAEGRQQTDSHGWQMSPRPPHSAPPPPTPSTQSCCCTSKPHLAPARPLSSPKLRANTREAADRVVLCLSLPLLFASGCASASRQKPGAHPGPKHLLSPTPPPLLQ